MNAVLCVVRIVVIGSLLAGAATRWSAQNTQSTEGEVILTTLSKPHYPPLARQTRVAGDLNLMLNVRADGDVQSIDVVNGHPLLTQAALDSAQLSRFECRRCAEAVTSSRLIYTFQLVGPDKCCTETKGHADEVQPDQLIPRVIQSQNHVTVIDNPVCFCDAGAQIDKVRSLKCLYLWRCSFR